MFKKNKNGCCNKSVAAAFLFTQKADLNPPHFRKEEQKFLYEKLARF